MPPPESGPSEHHRLPLHRQPMFVALFVTALVSNTGSWMQGFSEQWLVVVLAGPEAPRWAGRMGFAAGIAMLLLAPFAAATGVGLAVSTPVFSSLFPSIVRHEQLASGSGYMAAQFNLSRILGPALAALVITALGAGGNFLINAMSFPGLIAVALRLPAAPPRPADAPTASYGQAVRQCRHDAQLKVAMILSVVAGAFAWSYHTFVTVYAVRYLRLEAQGAATLLAAYGLGLVAIGLVPSYTFALGAAAVLGAAHAVFGSLLSVVVQQRAPEAMRGRLSALYVMAILGTTPLANLAAGEVAQWLGFHGVRWVLALQGIGLAGAAAWAASRAPSYEEPGVVHE